MQATGQRSEDAAALFIQGGLRELCSASNTHMLKWELTSPNRVLMLIITVSTEAEVPNERKPDESVTVNYQL